jgi:hypothetical protein
VVDDHRLLVAQHHLDQAWSRPVVLAQRLRHPREVLLRIAGPGDRREPHLAVRGSADPGHRKPAFFHDDLAGLGEQLCAITRANDQ